MAPTITRIVRATRLALASMGTERRLLASPLASVPVLLAPTVARENRVYATRAALSPDRVGQCGRPPESTRHVSNPHDAYVLKGGIRGEGRRGR